MWRPQYNNHYQLESEMGQGASLSELDFLPLSFCYYLFINLSLHQLQYLVQSISGKMDK